ncbi:hypothetical protein Bealeia2_02085 (plasmid) [Candidatus Bealeia paramacronuclearis]|uniref:portal protein n=1 Tax=Candidatus Bealeia paramacronuclearis TaxID=1921001 RepID=UPI002BBE96A6|nr:hypothetical protein [Candidatus Bealeia paramacronuclearis]
MHKRDTFYGNDQDATNVIAFPNGDDFDDTSLPLDDVDVPFEEEQEEDTDGFWDDITDELSEASQDKVVTDLIRGISEDKASREGWEQQIQSAIQNLGLSWETVDKLPFAQATGAFDTTLMQACLQFYALAQAELFPAEGPAKIKTFKRSDAFFEDCAERVEQFLNWQLTSVDSDYYVDSRRMLFYLILLGSAFKKVYTDPLTQRPTARFIRPQHLLIDNETSSLTASDRITHILNLSRQDLQLRQQYGFYREVDLDIESDDLLDSPIDDAIRNLDGVASTSERPTDYLTVWESYSLLTIDEDQSDDAQSIAKPYIVTLLPESRQILSIRRNWRPEDTTFARINYFVQYTLLPGLGNYGLGYAQLLGGNSTALTSLLRQLIDKGILSNFPGGLIAGNIDIANNDKMIGPGEFHSIPVYGKDLRSSIIPLPYGEPSMVLKDLYDTLSRKTLELASCIDHQIADQSANTPVGTTLAHLDVSGRLQMAMLRGLRESLSQELTLLYQLWGGTLTEDPMFFSREGEMSYVSAQDFQLNHVISPTADSGLSTQTQRIARAQELLKLAQSAPQLFNQHAVYERICRTLGIENIDEVLITPDSGTPLDPVSENMRALSGASLGVAPWQNHVAHIQVHEAFLAQNPQLSPVLMAHIAEHQAQLYALQMQMMTGVELPLNQDLPPAVQNQVALMVANSLTETADTQPQAPQPIDPQQLIEIDIQERAEASRRKLEEAEIKAMMEKLKAQMKFQTEVIKEENKAAIAHEKNQTDLIIAQLKQDDVAIEHHMNPDGEVL